MLDAQGNTVPAGKGAPMSWKQDGYLKKFFVTYLDPNAPAPQIETAQGAVSVLTPQAQLNDVQEASETL